MSRVLRARTAPALLAGVLSIAAVCGGEPAAVEDADRQITREELIRMTLTLDQFGPEFEGFVADAGNGATTAESIAQDDFDPDEEAGDLEEFGWEAGAEALFRRTTPGAAAPGVFILGSNVSLFESTDGAEGYIKDVSEEIGTAIGKSAAGVTLTKAERFAADVAKESYGSRFEVSVTLPAAPDGSTPEQVFNFVGLNIVFRGGRTLGTVSLFESGLSEGEEGRLQGRVHDLARKLEAQIAMTLEGATPAVARP